MFNRQYVDAASKLFDALYAINAADGPEANERRATDDLYMSEATAYTATKAALNALIIRIIPHEALRIEFVSEWLLDNFGCSFTDTLERFEQYVING